MESGGQGAWSHRTGLEVTQPESQSKPSGCCHPSCLSELSLYEGTHHATLLELSMVREQGDLDTMNVSLKVFSSELGEVWGGARGCLSRTLIGK